MHVVITGGTGVVGRPLVERLLRRGHVVTVWSRDPNASRLPEDARVVGWTPEDSADWARKLAGCDALVHLARSPLPRLWTPETRAALRETRLSMVRRLVDALAATGARPGTFVCASSHDFYGARPAGVRVTEKERAGEDFLASLYAAVEAEAARAGRFGVRMVQARIGAVLGPGAVNPKWIPHVVADPEGPLSWVHVDDAAKMLCLLLENDSVSGPVNVTAPDASSATALWRQIQATLGRMSDRAPPRSALHEEHVTFQPHWAYPAAMKRLEYRWCVTDLAHALAHLREH